MSVALPDVNVLVALFDPAHLHHTAAHRWFGRERKLGWATCPITANGCVRVLSHASYPSFKATPEEVISRMRTLCAAPDHQWWSDTISLLDPDLFRAPRISGPGAITDAYLLGLAVRYRGHLVTFDRSIPLNAVIGADAGALAVLDPA